MNYLLFPGRLEQPPFQNWILKWVWFPWRSLHNSTGTASGGVCASVGVRACLCMQVWVGVGVCAGVWALSVQVCEYLCRCEGVCAGVRVSMQVCRCLCRCVIMSMQTWLCMCRCVCVCVSAQVGPTRKYKCYGSHRYVFFLPVSLQLRLMQSEQTVEAVVRERSLKVLKERCWQVYRPLENVYDP